MAGVVEAQERPAEASRPVFEELRLGAGHVGAEAAEKHDAGASAGRAAAGDAAAVGEVERFVVHPRLVASRPAHGNALDSAAPAARQRAT